jgi:hypothetical protein
LTAIPSATRSFAGMAFLKRVSDGFWSYLSPSKADATDVHPTPRTLPNPQSRTPANNRRHVIAHQIRRTRSMSPTERIDTWVAGGALDSDRKRKWLPTPSTDVGSSKRARLDIGDEEEDEDVDMDEDDEDDDDDEEEKSEYEEGDGAEVVYDDDEIEVAADEEAVEEYEEEVFDEEELNNTLANVNMRSGSGSTSTPRKRRARVTHVVEVEEEQEQEQDLSNIIPEDEYYFNSGRKVVDITREHESRGISTEEMRAQGWDDDHISLVQKIAMRGFEPLMYNWYRNDFRYLPEVLFTDDEAKGFIGTVQGHRRYNYASRVLQKMMEMGGDIRARARGELTEGRVKTPEDFIIDAVDKYVKWAEKDAGLEIRKRQPTKRIPMIAYVVRPFGTAANEMHGLARERMARLHTRWSKAFQARKSIENSPSSVSTNAKLTHPIPQIYSLIASGTVVVLAAYRPDEAEAQAQVKTVAFFDFKDYGYDAWNVIALASIVNHARNVQLRIAEETGVGQVVPGTEDPIEDPDL